MPFEKLGTPPDPSSCTDLGRVPMGIHTPHDAPEQLAGKPIPDSARIREAVYIMQRKGGAHKATIQLKAGPATLFVGPHGWRLEK